MQMESIEYAMMLHPTCNHFVSKRILISFAKLKRSGRAILSAHSCGNLDLGHLCAEIRQFEVHFSGIFCNESATVQRNRLNQTPSLGQEKDYLSMVNVLVQRFDQRNDRAGNPLD